MRLKRFKYFVLVLAVAIQASVYISVWAASSKVGDLNGDNLVNSTDYSLMKRFLLDIIDDFPVEDESVGDINVDGRINSTDYALLRRIILGISQKNDEPYPEWDKIRKGYCTYTGTGYVGGIALLDPIPEDMEIAAVNKPEFNSYGVQAALAGAYLEITGPKGTTVCYATDCYTEAFEGALDLCRISCDKLGDTNVPGGKIDLEWRIIASPNDGNFTYRVLPATSKWWMAIQVRNHKYPLMKMEYYDNGNWIDLPKDRCNYFVIKNLNTSTPRIRLTDIRGKVVEDVIDSIPEDTVEGCFIPGNVQFPD